MNVNKKHLTCKESISLCTLTTAVELGNALLDSVVGNELGAAKLNELGRDGISEMLLSVIQKTVKPEEK